MNYYIKLCLYYSQRQKEVSKKLPLRIYHQIILHNQTVLSVVVSFLQNHFTVKITRAS